MECRISENKENCNCTYPCDKKGLCCKCISYHRKMNQLPACYFSDEYEKTYDRSIENFIKLLKNK